ncbi:TonB-dependent receptor domain-containing protein [Brevundimonas vesicularis]|uniref:TonB-dependent receptor domain-containing protein n=1 Tax=Brevundimonas vesicularis TaxID=41276 RepID=UPI0038D38DEE
MALFRTALLTGTACALLASPVLAQSTQTQPEKTQSAETARDEEQDEPANQVEDIEVRATSSAPRTSIDSISYSTADDLQASTGTLADALRNIPSVEVDPEGNLSLRGNPSVTVLVDGRPSPMFNGQTRAQVLQQIPANQYERIEVMTNPSAAHSAEGSGGIINLISKQTTKDAAQQTMQLGSVRVNVGEDRYNLGVNLMRNAGKLTLSGNAGIRHDSWRQKSQGTTEYFGSATRPATQAITTGEASGTQDNWMLGGNAQYRLSDTVTLSGNLFYIDIANPIDVDSQYVERNGAGTVVNAYDYDGDGEWAGQIGVASVGMVKNFGETGHEWSNTLNLHRMLSRMGMDLAQLNTVPARPVNYDRTINKDLNYNWTLTSAYVRPMDNGSKLRTGYELNYTDLDKDTLAFQGPALDSLTIDPRTTNQFAVRQAVHALYATYERPFGDDFSAQFGLRAEQTDREVQQLTSGQTIRWDDLSLYPTLHLSYQLNDQQSLRGSYSRRIERPRPDQLNPYLVRNSATSYSEGNPYLRPQETDSFEIMWQKRVRQTFYQATLFYRDADGAFTTVTSELEPGVFLSRPENLGSSRSMGLELVANGALMPKLRYNASLTYADIEIDATGLPQSRDRAGDSLSGRLTLDWRPTDRDFLQVSGVWAARQIQAQGETETEPLFNLGYRRKLNEDWALQLTARDLLDEYGSNSTIITPDFSQQSAHTFGGRSVFVGLTWNFGQGPRREEQFDFNAPSTPR